MYENIALIKEFHEHLPTKEAQLQANEYLKKIQLENIGLKRVTQCTEVEIFYVMFIRALMTKEMSLIIASPFSITNSLVDVKTVMDNISTLNSEKKNILILDVKSNEPHYKGSLCNMIK